MQKLWKKQKKEKQNEDILNIIDWENFNSLKETLNLKEITNEYYHHYQE